MFFHLLPVLVTVKERTLGWEINVYHWSEAGSESLVSKQTETYCPFVHELQALQSTMNVSPYFRQST